MGSQGSRRSLLLFALLAVYIAAQFIWWAVLLLRRDKEIDVLQAQVAALTGGVAEPTDPSRRLLMVMGEAGVFLAILLGLLVFMYRSVQRELRAATAQRNFLLAVTHELRTPIAAVKLQLQTLARQGLTDEQRETLRATANTEADRLAMLTDKVLLATAAEEDPVPINSADRDVVGLMRDAVERAKLGFASGHTVVLQAPEELIARCDVHALRSIVDNLIENAAKYAPTGSTITVDVKNGPNGWRLTVMDEGPGVPEEERSRIFERFYRAGSEETRSTKGTGLGLYIVDRLTRRAGGSIEVRARRPQGAIFAASFPHR